MNKTIALSYDASLADNVPGVPELEAAQNAACTAEDRYEYQLNKMMEDENNDGVNPPAALNMTLRETANTLANQYPRAAIYLRGKSYTMSNNDHKYSAGKKAMEIIATGGKIEEAIDTLNNWLPKSAMWD